MNWAYLIIEFLDELVFGAEGAAWPLIRTDLGLTYAMIGLAFTLPGLISSFVEPFIGILGDVWNRRALILGGGAFFTLSLGLIAISVNFPMLLAALILIYPASGAFVSLSQAALVEGDPDRAESNMAKWTFAGSLGVVLGPLLLGGLIFLGPGWRGTYAALAGISFLALILAWRAIPRSAQEHPPLPRWSDLRDGFAGALEALRAPSVVRWLVLLLFSDLMLDVLLGFLALYYTDVVGVSPAWAVLAVAVWTGVGLLGDFLLIPLVERVPGLDYLRWSVLLELLLFPAFLLVPNAWVKLALLGLLGLFNSGWYAILKAHLYRAMPGKGGTVMTLDNVFGSIGSFIPLLIGLAADRWGLGAAMWLLLLGPVVLMIGLPRRRERVQS